MVKKIIKINKHPSKGKVRDLQDIANLLRRDVLQMTTESGSGHPSSCLSCAEIISTLFFNEMRFDPKDARNPDNDEFVLSKGHAAPILYAALKRAGALKEQLSGYRTLHSHLEGHPIPSSFEPSIKVASGSLGQGLSVGLGMALALKMQKRDSRVYVLLGDSEIAEGSIYEAAELADYYKAGNLCAILDMNRLGQSGQTMLGYNSSLYKKRFKAFGWHVITIDGHSIKQINRALKKSRYHSKSTLIIAKTVKGKGVSFIENKEGWHGRALTKEEYLSALKEIPPPTMPKISIKLPAKTEIKKVKPKKLKQIKFSLGDMIATREAYGLALKNLAKSNPEVIAIDAEVSNSTFSEIVKKINPEQFIEAYVAEQNMIGMALGLSIKNYHVFASSFAAFLSRAHDQIRMSALSNGNITICGSHAGVSVGQDGASQMGLEDIALFRDLPDSKVFYPSDAVSTEKLLDLTNQLKGIKYIRTTRAKTPVIYKKDEKFTLGDFKVIRKSSKDSIVLIGSGITLHECIKAYAKLKHQNISAAVIDLYCIKPLNIHKLANFIKEHGNKIIIAEDHYSAGGIGEMLAHELLNTGIRIKTLSINKAPHSGTTEELLDKYSINARHIVMHAKTFV
ncbi:MAG: transketolase [Nanoarchaeota archaeon]